MDRNAKCRAKNPSHCPYHGTPDQTITKALMTNDVNAYMAAREQLGTKVREADKEVRQSHRNFLSYSREADNLRAKYIQAKDEFEEVDRLIAIEDSQNPASLKYQALVDDHAVKKTALRFQAELHVGAMSHLQELESAYKESESKLKTLSAEADREVHAPSISLEGSPDKLHGWMTSSGLKAVENYNSRVSKIIANNSSLAKKTKAIDNLRADIANHYEQAMKKFSKIPSKQLSTMEYSDKLRRNRTIDKIDDSLKDFLDRFSKSDFSTILV